MQREPIIRPEYMPEANRKYLWYNAEEVEAWVATVGPKTVDIVNIFPLKCRHMFLIAMNRSLSLLLTSDGSRRKMHLPQREIHFLS